MASYDTVNYSLRPNKSIQRALVFEAYRKISTVVDLSKAVYIGLGSIWFSDFVAAHKQLHIRDLISIESDEVGYKRAVYNRPFKCVQVRKGLSTSQLRKLAEDEKFNQRPWFVWLDYDSAVTETLFEDVDFLVEHAPSNSFVVISVNVDERSYGKFDDREERVQKLFGELAPDEIQKENLKGAYFCRTVNGLIDDIFRSRTSQISRPGGFVSAVNLVYRDGPWMGTVGGFLPSAGGKQAVKPLIENGDWPSLPANAVATPPLTLKEITAMQSALPRRTKLSRASIKQLGFDLLDEQIEAFETFYKYYPSFAQITN